MTVGRICSRVVDTARADEFVTAVAQRMLEANVGSLPVLDGNDRLVGIITDRDLALRVVAERREGQATRVAEVMSECLQTVDEDTPIEAALAAMRKRRVRRLPVVDDGRLVGILTLDDVLALLGEELGAAREVLESESPRRVLDRFVPDAPPHSAARSLASPEPATAAAVQLRRVERTLEEIRDSLDVAACALSIGLEVRLLGGGVVESDVREAADRRLREIIARAQGPTA